MSSTVSNPMNLPALVCPSCDNQISKPDLWKVNLSSYDSFVQDLSCPDCDEDYHPEDGFLHYLQMVPSSEALGRPLTIGGFASVGTQDLEIGKTEEVGIIGGGGGIEVNRTLQAETDLDGGLMIEDLDGEQFKWYGGRLLIDDAVVVNIVAVDEGKVGFITSEREATDQREVTVAHNIHSRLAEINQPPWVELLEEAAEAFYSGHGIAEYPLLWAALENLLGRELARTLRSQGKSQAEIDRFLNKYRNWYERCNDGLAETTGYELENYDQSTFNKLDNYRVDRNNKIIHVDPDEDVAQISTSDMKEIFSTTIDGMTKIYEICYQARV
jgi:hypothetical protein